MAHKKGLGSSRNGRDSNAKRLGVKVFAGQTVTGGEIIVRQRGTRFKPGDGVGIGKDDTIYARSPGTVQFNRGRRGRVISVEPDASWPKGGSLATGAVLRGATVPRAAIIHPGGPKGLARRQAHPTLLRAPRCIEDSDAPSAGSRSCTPGRAWCPDPPARAAPATR